MHLKDFLNERALEAAATPLPSLGGADQVARWQDERREALLNHWGLDAHQTSRAHGAPTLHVVGSFQDQTHAIERVWFEALPGLVVTANLYLPLPSRPRRRPAVIYLCGHRTNQKVNYQEHPRRLAQLGFVSLIIDTILDGEFSGAHRGTYELGAFHWISRGYSPAAAEAWTAVRAFDVLAARTDVDPARVGVTGHSGGGAVSWWAAAVEPRIAAVATSCGTGGEASHVVDRTIDGHCDCCLPTAPQSRPFTEIYALVAPRPTLIVAPRKDSGCNVRTVRDIHAKLSQWYRSNAGTWPLKLLEVDVGHCYTPESRRTIFSWFERHLAQRDSTPDEMTDVDAVRHERDRLLVFGPHAPKAPPVRNSTVQDWFVSRLRHPPAVPEMAASIRSTCLAFADEAEPLEVRIDRVHERNDREYLAFSYVTERGWRLRAAIIGAVDAVELVVALRSPAEFRSPDALPLATAAGTATTAILDVRGTGDSAWHPALNWHLRRAAALLGRSIASMRVWDTLRGVQALRTLCSASEVTVVADGEMAVPALFATVVDPTIDRAVLSDLPPTLDRADDSGAGAMIEIPHALRIADIPDLVHALGPDRVSCLPGGRSPVPGAQTA